MDKQVQRSILESKVVSAEHVSFDLQTEIEALTAEAGLASEEQKAGYDERIAQMKLDADKADARLKSFKTQLKALS